MKTYMFYPGCSFAGTGGYDVSFVAVSKALGVEFKTLPDWNCCGATLYKSISKSKTAALVARNFALLADAGASEIVVPCNSCFTNLVSERDHLQEDDVLRKKVEKALLAIGRKLVLDVTVRHALDVFVEDIGVDTIKAKVVKPLKGLTFAPYYGCQYSRPPRNNLSTDNPDNLDKLIVALGAKASPFASKLLCCGSSQVVGHTPETMHMIADVLHDAQAHECDAVLTCCPMCNLNLEAYQTAPLVAESLGHRTVPVAFFTQAMGAAFGLDHAQLGLDSLIMAPTLEPKAAPAQAPKPGATASA